jgi:hypothetical protein
VCHNIEMKKVETLLFTQHHETEMHQPGVGSTRLGFEAVKGIQLPNTAPRIFSHYLFDSSGAETAERIQLPEEKAERLLKFSDDHFVDGKGDFDCRAFLHFIEGWEDEVKTGVPKLYYGSSVRPEDTLPAEPYVVEAKGPTPHAMLGIDRPSHSLSVAGYEHSLIVAENMKLVRAFGGTALCHVDAVAASQSA